MMIGLIVQARMNSSRLPKKVLNEINGIPLLLYLVTRLKSSVCKSICVATSDCPEDDIIEEFCTDNGISYFRGELEDVAKRILDATIHFNVKAFVRINGDSPLIDPKIIDQAVEIFQNGNYDLVTNTFPRSFPIGQSVEVIRTSTFEKVYEKMLSLAHFEHVTKYYYEHPDEFRIKNFSNYKDLTSYRLVVDTPEDLKRMEKIIGSMTRPYTEYGLDDLIELYPSV